MNVETGNDYQIQRMVANIERAYRLLAVEPGAWVSLARIQDHIDAPRDVITEAYRRLGRRYDVALIPESNQKVLTSADQYAAVWVGNQWKHLIAFCDNSDLTPL